MIAKLLNCYIAESQNCHCEKRSDVAILIALNDHCLLDSRLRGNDKI